MDKILLKRLIANTASLASQFQLAHWNVTGINFQELHAFFGAEYASLNASTDLLAEHYRTLGEFSIGGLTNLSENADIPEMKAEKGHSAQQFLKALLVGHRKCRENAQELVDDAGKEGNLHTQQIALDQVLKHDKAIWMLQSMLY